MVKEGEMSEDAKIDDIFTPESGFLDKHHVVFLGVVGKKATSV